MIVKKSIRAGSLSWRSPNTVLERIAKKRVHYSLTITQSMTGHRSGCR
jgi:hypothetical protein